IPDLVRDGGGQLVDARLLLRLHGRAFTAQLPLDGRLEEALPQQPRAEDRHVVREEPDPPAERRPDEPGIASGEEVDDPEKCDDPEVAEQVSVEACLRGGASTRARQRIRGLALSIPLAVSLPVPRGTTSPSGPLVAQTVELRVRAYAALEVREEHHGDENSEEGHRSGIGLLFAKATAVPNCMPTGARPGRRVGGLRPHGCDCGTHARLPSDGCGPA